MEISSCFCTSFLAVILVLLLLKSLIVKPRNQKRKLPPGPWKLPIIGSIHHLVGALPHRRLKDLARLHGPLFHLKLGQVDYVIASSPAAAHEILKTHDVAFASRPALMAIKTIAYNCSGMGFSPYGPYWRQLRRVCAMELLNNRRVKTFAPIRREEAAQLVKKVGDLGGQSPVNLAEVFLELTNNHLTRAAFGKECRSRGRFLMAMKETIRLAPVVSPMDLFPSMGFVIGLLDGSMREMKRLHGEIDTVLDEIISDHRAKKVAGGEEEEEDLVDVLLRIQANGELEIPLQMLHIKAVILDMLVAATETTASTLNWVMTELVRNPHAMEKCREETRRVLHGKNIEESDMEELHYLKQVIKETLRLHPPLPLLLPRTCNKDVEMMGYTVPSKSRVMVNAWAIGRDSGMWAEPERFMPERFENGGVDFKGGSFEYIPFGAGRRMCPGMAFAMAGMELFLAILLLNFDWKIPEGKGPDELDVEEEFDGALRRKNDLCLLALPSLAM
ncbi:hypothetical protein HPP92_006283 [Vanilla planifolia]|uniref:Premnaspirodiene oxygenase n=1 Tax=Vanilla planifolia TaxID=51239 RepID=A0A835RR62_VANPL|nr:hypothetical protein HPP92_006283 [Vanilla planifolia]